MSSDGGRVDLRKNKRTQTRQEGRIFLKRGTVVHCMVTDLSQAGAKLTLTKSQHLPETFDLVILGSDFRTIPCDLRWQKGNVAGVAFRSRNGADQLLT
ncbi:PilZ domain-containing protein [Microvirga sp. GCM10011540]|uniref:PilZ domain-containing protein n=1 Tax=Microvirga sp. GCM10011540 TaxID=3317338 RepID=UPI00360C064F